MKRAVLGMLEENYDYEQSGGTLQFSCDSLELSFVDYEKREGKFTIVSTGGNWMEGFIFSNHFRMRCNATDFVGNNIDVTYTFDSTGMESGETIQGDIQIVSNFGEYSLPFTATMDQEFLFSSMGPIKNLFHFANLAKTNWQEAVNLFYASEFPVILKGNDAGYLNIYRGLSAVYGNQRNVEAFLIAVKKKTQITYAVDLSEITIDEVETTICREIAVTRTGWGYSYLTVTSKEAFLRVEKDDYSEDDFLGNVCRIPVYIDVKDLYYGKNVGAIEIFDGVQTSEVTFIVRYFPNGYSKTNTSENKELTLNLTKLYLSFRMGEKDLHSWTKESMCLVDHLTARDDKDISARLYQAQLLIAGERYKEAKWILERVEELLSREGYDTQQEAYYLYLTALCDKENSDYIDKITHKIRKMYHKEEENWRLAWILLYLQEDLQKNAARKWDFLEEHYNYGAFTPVLYVEAVSILKDNPSLLIKLSSYELQLLRFLSRREKLTTGIVERVQFLCSREREYRPKVFLLLQNCYKKYPSKELLQTICGYLMKGNKTGAEYFSWYEKGVKEELRLTRLYDFYMMSINLKYEGELPKIIMMYFAYQNDLPYDRAAFLYAKILACSGKYPEIALTYTETIDRFIREQLSKGRVNDEMAYLYRKAVATYMLDDAVAASLAPIIFMKRIVVDDTNVRSVVAIHKKVTEEKRVSVTDGIAYIPVYSKDYALLFEDGYGNRKEVVTSQPVTTIDFSESLRNEIISRTGDKLGVLLNICEGSRDFVTITSDNVFAHARLLRSEWITPEYQKEILVSLVKYYYENDCVRELDELLTDTNPKVLSRMELREFIRILVARGMYDKAYEWVITYGPESAEEKTLLRLTSRLVERRDFEEDYALTEMSSYIFRRNKYDQNILSYLVKYFNGSAHDLRLLWNASNAFGIDNYVLVERFLIQILYADIFIGEKMELYKQFCQNSGNTDIEMAFLSKSAYDYFVKESPTGDKVFERIEQLLKQEEKMSRVCKLALLKYYSEMPKDTVNAELVERIVTDEIRGQYYFPMFAAFQGEVPDISLLSDKTFIEYRGSVHSRVILHYVLLKKSGEEEYRKEEMTNMYGGIFVKGFVLFYGETIQYYITEENGNCEQLTQSSTLQKKEDGNNGGDSRYEILNDIMLSKEIKDYETCMQLMRDYAKKSYIISKIFS